jgi:DNA-binding HxlR family transcriptional regulator
VPVVARRSYGEYCALARALDLVGERWTILVVRELILGPKRFTDLLEGLDGVGRNLLADRLRVLEREGVVRRRELPPPAASRVYELTEEAIDLTEAMGALTRWGARRLGRRRRGEVFHPGWMAMAMTAGASRDAARGVRETYQFDVDDEPFHIRVDDGDVLPRTGRSERADLVVTMSSDTLAGLVGNELSPPEALAGGLITLAGPPEAFVRCVTILGGGREAPAT